MSRRIWAPVAATVFSVGVLWQMDRQTIASYSPKMAAVMGPSAAPLASAGVDVYELARSDAGFVAQQLGVNEDSATSIVRHAQLVTLRGIGTHYADIMQKIGIRTIDDLANADARTLAARMTEVAGEPIQSARVRIWVKGARHAVARAAAATN
jgi:predicted flap endonuclease-1-like 5' DNA nuclease